MEAPRAAKLIVGPAGSGKTTAALADYRNSLLSRPSPLAPRPSLWLAPTFAVAQEVREALIQDAADAFLDPGVTTFAALAEDVIRDAGLRLRIISALSRRRLLARIIAQAVAAGALRHFAAVADTPGFLALVEDWIADRQRREPPPKRAPAPRARSSPRRQDLEELYARYHAALSAAQLLDAESSLWAARDALARIPGLLAGLDLVVADGFTDFTIAEAALLQALAPRTRRLQITLPGEDPGWHAPRSAAGRGELLGDSTTPVADSERATPSRQQFTKTRLTAATIREGFQAQTVHLPAHAGPWPALDHLEQNLFRDFRAIEPPSPAAVASASRIHIVATSGVQAEIEEVARRVKELLVAGERPGDVVVAFRSTRDAADRLRLAFADFGIPFWLDAPRWLNSSPLVRTLLSILQLAAEDWPYRRLLAVVGNESVEFSSVSEGWHDPRSAAGRGELLSDSTTPVADSGRATQSDIRTAVELCVRHAQLPAGRQALLDQLAAWAADGTRTAEPSPAAAELASAALSQFSELLAALPERTTIARWTAAVENLARPLGLLAADDAQGVWKKLAAALHEVERLDASTAADATKLALSDFIDLAATIAAELPLADQFDAVGRVRILSAEAARFTRPRHLFLAGLSEESFAARRSIPLDDESPDDEPSASGDVNLGDSAADEMLLFYQLVMRPTETLTLSYAALDAKAQSLVPSPLLAELERSFGDIRLQRTVQTLGGAPADAPAPLSRSALRRTAVRQAMARHRDLLAALASSGWHAPRSSAGRGGFQTDATTPLPSSSTNIGQSILDGIESIASRTRRDQFGPFDGIVDSPATQPVLAKDFGADHLWSPSQLETYAECPFRFFGQQTLKLAPPPELALAADMARRGHLLHDALARLYAMLTAAGVPAGADAADTARLLAEQFRTMVDQAAAVRPGRGLDAALREIERRQIADWADRLAEQDALYRTGHAHLDAPMQPTYFEASFGPRSRHSQSDADARLSTLDPFELAVPVAGAQERAQFGGQIDRIDVGRVGARPVFNVIDYKSGRTVIDMTKVETGKQLQLALYSMAAAELLLADQQAAPLSASYWTVGGKSKGGYALGGRGAKPLEFHQVVDGALQPSADWTKLRKTMVERIGELIADIRHGFFPVYNDDENCTEHCDLRTICRIAQVRSLEKTWPLPVKRRTGDDSRKGAKAQKAEKEDKEGETE